MLIKGSQRGSGANLAAHLLKTDDNEHVLVHEVKGFASDNLHDAFKEAEAISLGTKCRQYLFSVSINPPQPENVPLEVFEDTIDRIEKRLGLVGQPRAVVFHEKENRLHVHAVWSRVDAATMTAKHMPFFKNKLFALARDLHLELGFEMPRGMAEKGAGDPTNFTLAEWQQCKRQGVDPRWLKKSIQDCWSRSDGLNAFQGSLIERGFHLAKGDRRGHLVVDHTGEVYSLSRMLGVKAKDVRARLGEGDKLQDVEATRKLIGERMTPVIRRHIAEAKDRFQSRYAKLDAYKKKMVELHRTARQALKTKQKREWDAETLVRANRLPKGLRGLWHRLTGEYQKVRKLNETEAQSTRERHVREREVLMSEQSAKRSVLQSRVTDLREQQAKKLSALRMDIGRYLEFGRLRQVPQTPLKTSHPGLRLRL
ncbi:MAG: relaxase [Pseudomonadota bacterium]